MSLVEFEEEQTFIMPNRPQTTVGSSKMSTWLMKRGIVKSNGQATLVLVAVMIFMFAASAAVLMASPPVRNFVFPKKAFTTTRASQRATTAVPALKTSPTLKVR